MFENNDNFNEEYIWCTLRYGNIQMLIGYCIGTETYNISVKYKKQKPVVLHGFYFRDLVKEILLVVFGDGLLKPSRKIRRLKKKLYQKWYKHINIKRNML